MAEQGGGGSSVNLVAIIAIVILVGLAAWFFMGQKPRQAAAPAAKQPASEKKSDIEVKVDLPDTVTIK
jgi:flagellar basal body-associated protein FliL